jgi:hypothetical protein
MTYVPTDEEKHRPTPLQKKIIWVITGYDGTDAIGTIVIVLGHIRVRAIDEYDDLRKRRWRAAGQ